MKKYILKVLGIAFFALSFAAAAPHAYAADLSIIGLYPGTSVIRDTQVTFTTVPNGFTGNVTYSVTDSFAGGVTNANINSSGYFSWTPNQDDVGSHTITVTGKDSSGNTASIPVTITVTDVGSLTISSLSPGGSVQIGTPVTFVVRAAATAQPTFSASDSFAYSSLRYNAIDANGNFSWTPVAQDIGAHTITITARQAGGATMTATQDITVTGNPSASLTSVMPGTVISPGQRVIFSATTTNYASPVFSLSDSFVGVGTSTLSIDSTGAVNWLPTANDIGGHNIVITVSDSAGHSTTLPITLTVVPGSAAYSLIPSVVAATSSASAVQSGTSTNFLDGTGVKLNHSFSAFIGVGSRGADVLALQLLLINLKLFNGTATGYFGPLTKASLQQFQKLHGISAVGYAGPATRTALNAAEQ